MRIHNETNHIVNTIPNTMMMKQKKLLLKNTPKTLSILGTHSENKSVI